MPSPDLGGAIEKVEASCRGRYAFGTQLRISYAQQLAV